MDVVKVLVALLHRVGYLKDIIQRVVMCILDGDVVLLVCVAIVEILLECVEGSFELLQPFARLLMIIQAGNKKSN